MEAITPILQEFSIDQPKLYLGGSQAIVEPEADCAFLYDNVLIIDRGEPTDEFDGKSNLMLYLIKYKCNLQYNNVESISVQEVSWRL